MKLLNGEKTIYFQDQLTTWYEKNKRPLPWRETRDVYRIWVSEVMLQQTQVNTVIPYYQRFIESFPDISILAQAELQSVLKLWEGLGYYARARNLHKAAQIVCRKHDRSIPDTPADFRQLPGVGDYICAAVSSIAHGYPLAVVDGNVKRVLSRFFLIDAPVNQSTSYGTYRETADRILDKTNPGRFNQAIMELGAMICKPRNPFCEKCPVHVDCQANRLNKTPVYPKRITPKKIPEYRIAAGVIFRQGRVLITQRPENGLLGGLWEFPGGKIKPNETPEAACLREIKEETGLTVQIESFLTQVKHAYTHFMIRMDVFRCKYISGDIHLNGPADFKWIDLSEIEGFPFPRANHKFLHLL